MGEGKLITFEDSSPCIDGAGKPSKTIKLVFNVREISQMIPSHLNQPLSNSSFALEKHSKILSFRIGQTLGLGLNTIFINITLRVVNNIELSMDPAIFLLKRRIRASS